MAKKKVIEKKTSEELDAKTTPAKGKKGEKVKGKKEEKKKEKKAEAPAEKPDKKVAKKAVKKAAKKAVKKATKKAATKTAKKAAKKGTKTPVSEEPETAAPEGIAPAEDLLERETETQITETFDEESQLERDFRTAEAGAEEQGADVILDRIYVVPLRKAQAAPRQTRAKHAIELLKKFVVRHMKPESLTIAQVVNERIWEHGIYKPPRRIRIRATKNTEGQVTVTLAE